MPRCFAISRCRAEYKADCDITTADKERLKVLHLLGQVFSLQDAQKLMAEAVWQADRLAAELAESDRSMARLASLSLTAGDMRNVVDVDNDLENLENERAALEQHREQAMRKHERLK